MPDPQPVQIVPASVFSPDWWLNAAQKVGFPAMVAGAFMWGAWRISDRIVTQHERLVEKIVVTQENISDLMAEFGRNQAKALQILEKRGGGVDHAE